MGALKRLKAKPRRLTKFTPQLKKDLCDCLAIGLTIEQSCAVLGISPTMFSEWSRHPEFSVCRAKAEETLILALKEDIKQRRNHGQAMNRPTPLDAVYSRLLAKAKRW